jgi:micrococcal nuclease
VQIRNTIVFSVLISLIAVLIAPLTAQDRAPAGGITVNGKFYKGGQFIPGGSSGFGGFSGPSSFEMGAGLAADRNAAGAAAKAQRQANLLNRAANRAATAAKKTESKKQEERIFGRVVSITDGDTLEVLTDSKQLVKVRMDGIDAPEKDQPFGQSAKSALSTAAFNREVMVISSDKDKYGRTLGKVFVGGSDLNKTMVSNGMAWQYVEFNSDPVLAFAEKSARQSRRGLWSQPNPIPPWVWRHAGK